MKPRIVKVGKLEIGRGRPLTLIAGPCVIESERACLRQAEWMAEWARRDKVPLIFKASYDKANRSSHKSFRGVGLQAGVDILRRVKAELGLPVLTDVHREDHADIVGEVADVLQIPAFLCRQTDLLVATAVTGCVVNVKKGQFLSPQEMGNIVEKLKVAGASGILLTERGTTFGFHNLVVDMRGLPVMQRFGWPVVFDATHSTQSPGGLGDRSGGDRSMASVLARAAVAAGCDAVFVEVHPRPERALSDAATQLPLSKLPRLFEMLREIHGIVNE